MEYVPWVLQMEKISRVMSQKEKLIEDEIERQKAHKKQARELDWQEELRDAERQMWQEKKAELKMTEKKTDIEKTAKASLAKLSQLKVTPLQRNGRRLGKIWKHIPYENWLHQFLMKKNSRRRNTGKTRKWMKNGWNHQLNSVTGSNYG